VRPRHGSGPSASTPTVAPAHGGAAAAATTKEGGMEKSDAAAELRAEIASLRQQLQVRQTGGPGPGATGTAAMPTGSPLAGGNIPSGGSGSTALFPYSVLATAFGSVGHGGGGVQLQRPTGPAAGDLPVAQLHPAVQFMHALTARSQSDAWLSALMFAAPHR